MTALGAVLGIANKVLDRVIPDKNARAEAKEKLLEVAQSNEFDLVLSQLEINKVEANHKSVFVAGARPATIWICNIVMVAVIVSSIVGVFKDFDISALQGLYMSTVLPIHGGLLGLRTIERVKANTTNAIRPPPKQ